VQVDHNQVDLDFDGVILSQTNAADMLAEGAITKSQRPYIA
jgi:hypothetical protein